MSAISTADSESGFLDVSDQLGPMSLSVEGEMMAGRTTSVSCSITHSCPSSLPIFTWRHPGWEDIQQTPLEHGQLRTTSTLRLQPSREDHNKSLQCSIRYRGGEQQESMLLKVMCKYVIAANLGKRRMEFFFLFLTDVPEIRNVSHCTSDAKRITCVCIAESNPPSRLQFMLSDVVHDSTMKVDGTVTMGTLRVAQTPHKFIQCLANNTVGIANLTLSVKLLHSNVYF